MSRLSNLLSIRRFFLPRPKVCRTPKAKLPFVSVSGLFAAFGVTQKPPPAGHPLNDDSPAHINKHA
jgi:hypothetical protein